jgi:hypothetical protein
VAELYKEWHAHSGYEFNIRDYHLLKAMLRQPELADTRRSHLVADLAQKMAEKKHVPYYSGGEAPASYEARFYRKVDQLNIVDLWNIVLLDELLSRNSIQAGLNVLAQKDLADKQTAWGGLVIFERGRAKANQYPPARPEMPDDRTYQPTERLLTDSRNSLCRFICHFDNIENVQRTGPTPQELSDAAENNYYGMTITRLNADEFTAHYFNPDGAAISLGTFPFK